MKQKHKRYATPARARMPQNLGSTLPRMVKKQIGSGFPVTVCTDGLPLVVAFPSSFMANKEGPRATPFDFFKRTLLRAEE
jgi:hypothetical protein